MFLSPKDLLQCTRENCHIFHLLHRTLLWRLIHRKVVYSECLKIRFLTFITNRAALLLLLFPELRMVPLPWKHAWKVSAGTIRLWWCRMTVTGSASVSYVVSVLVCLGHIIAAECSNFQMFLQMSTYKYFFCSASIMILFARPSNNHKTKVNCCCFTVSLAAINLIGLQKGPSYQKGWSTQVRRMLLTVLYTSLAVKYMLLLPHSLQIRVSDQDNHD